MSGCGGQHAPNDNRQHHGAHGAASNVPPDGRNVLNLFDQRLPRSSAARSRLAGSRFHISNDFERKVWTVFELPTVLSLLPVEAGTPTDQLPTGCGNARIQL